MIKSERRQKVKVKRRFLFMEFTYSFSPGPNLVSFGMLSTDTRNTDVLK